MKSICWYFTFYKSQFAEWLECDGRSRIWLLICKVYFFPSILYHCYFRKKCFRHCSFVIIFLAPLRILLLEAAPNHSLYLMGLGGISTKSRTRCSHHSPHRKVVSSEWAKDSCLIKQWYYWRIVKKSSKILSQLHHLYICTMVGKQCTEVM